MIDYWGLVLTGIGTIVFVLKDPWDKKILNCRLSWGLIGVVLLSSGIIITGMSIYYNNIEKTGYKKQLDSIDMSIQKTYSTTNQGFENVLKDYEAKTNQLLQNFTENYNTLASTIIEQSDSALNSQLLKIKSDYRKLNDDYLLEKDIAQRYYFAEVWPWSDKNEDISRKLFYFIPTGLSGLVTGQDRYIIWYLIEKNGTFPYNEIVTLQEDIWTKLKPISISLNVNLKRLELLQVIKPYFWKSNVEFTDNFQKRLEVLREFSNNKIDKDTSIKKLFELEIEK